MRVLLQNTETKLYLIGCNQWTDDPSKATDFQEVQSAAEAYEIEDLAYARIVVDQAAPSASPLAFEYRFKGARPTI
ncbi:MAG TPA: hypothetical protein VKY92_13935 [Verrucomicrobiae bacterium]|nr:hypothetical protein [Verrucomicrobiae bacterium]